MARVLQNNIALTMFEKTSVCIFILVVYT